MKTKNQQLRHHILNIFTIMNYQISDPDLSNDGREELQQLLQEATLFVKHQNLLLGQEPELFIQSLSLKQHLEILHDILTDTYTHSEQKAPIRGEDFMLSTDQYHLSEALHALLQQLYQESTTIAYQLYPEKKELHILHDGEDVSLPHDQDWTELLDQKKPVTLWIAQALLRILNIEIQVQEHSIILSFPG